MERVGSRREFVRAGGRYGLLGLLALATGLAARSGGRCVNRGLCDGCGRFSRCELPPALSARAATKEVRS
jgi:hypothetical protein